MTARQLYYTSCAQGRDGGVGFQVNAATPGIPRWAEADAIRASSYELPLTVPGDGDEADALPVALGYALVRDVATVFQSRYVGRDYAGRFGNYFAHAVVLDDPAADLTGLLPIDLWRAPIWSHTPASHPELPPLGRFVPGSAAGPAATASFLAQAPRRRHLAAVLAAVTAALSGAGGRVVLVATDDDEAALWISGVTRSLPRHLALGTTFTTYSARADNSAAVLVATTPDAARHVTGGTVLDVTPAGAAGGRRLPVPSPFASVMARLWAHGADVVSDAVRRLDRDVTMTAAELDGVAPALELLRSIGGQAGDRSVEEDDEADEARPLGSVLALRAILTRPALCATPWPWDRLWRDVCTEVGAATARTLGIVGGLFHPAAVAGVPVPHEVRVALAAALVPLLARSDVDGLRILEQVGDDELLEVLGEQLGGAGGTDFEVAAGLPLAAVQLLAPAAVPGSRADRVCRIARARHGELDRVPVATDLRHEPGSHLPGYLDNLILSLWPDGLPPEDGLRLVSGWRTTSGADPTLIRHCVDGIIADSQRRRLRVAHSQLARDLLDEPTVAPGSSSERIVRAVVQGFAVVAPEADLSPEEWEATLDLTGEVLMDLGQWLRAQLVTGLLEQSDATRHHQLLTRAATGPYRHFLSSYVAGARSRGPDVPAGQLARWAAVWAFMGDMAYRRELVDDVLPELVGARRDEADVIAQTLARPPDDIARLVASRADTPHALTDWWERWIGRYAPSRLSRLWSVTRLRRE
jgi:hypothetical protein